MRSLTLDEFLTEPTASREVAARLVDAGAIVPLPDGRYHARGQLVASMSSALLDSSDPVPRTSEPYRSIVFSRGVSSRAWLWPIQ